MNHRRSMMAAMASALALTVKLPHHRDDYDPDENLATATDPFGRGPSSNLVPKPRVEGVNERPRGVNGPQPEGGRRRGTPPNPERKTKAEKKAEKRAKRRP